MSQFLKEIPSQPTPFVSRVEELAEITALLADPACRLLTIIGPGGVGKTRLALEAAQQLLFPGDTYFVALQSLTSSDLIVPAIAEAIHFQFYSGGEPKQQLLDYLREKTFLLVLDNLEHLLDGVGSISEILAYAPGIKIMTTSREVLNIREEWVYLAKGMHFPEDATETKFENYSAVQLFVQSARRARTDFKAEQEQAGIIRTCQLVEGMPLGIELASAWVRTLSCDEIAAEIDRSLDILATPSRNAPPRHRNIRAALEQSWNLLTDAEREVFKGLSVFRGGFRIGAAKFVAGATLSILSSLVDKSLLRVKSEGRYDIHELLRQYGEEQLNASPEERELIRDRHSAYYAEFMHQQWEHVKTHREKAVHDELVTETGNVRIAWRCMVEKHKTTEIGQTARSFCGSLMWQHRYQEGLDVFGQAAEVLQPISSDKEISRVYGLVLAMQCPFQSGLGVAEKAKVLAEESLALLRPSGHSEWIMTALQELAGAAFELNQIVESEAAIQEGLNLASSRNDLWWQAQFLGARLWAWIIGEKIFDVTEIIATGKQGLAYAEEVGDLLQVADFYLALGFITLEAKDFSEAKRYFEWTLRIMQDMENPWGIAMSYMGLAKVAMFLKNFTEARQYFGQELEIDLKVGSRRWQTDTILKLAPLLVLQGEHERATELLAHVAQHPATMKVNRDEAEHRLFELQAELLPDSFAAAVERGRARELDTTVRELIAEFRQPTEHTAKLSAATDGFSKRELEILQLIAEGLSNQEIADQLFLARGTVKWYIGEIYSKLSVRSRTQAVASARALHLLNEL